MLTARPDGSNKTGYAIVTKNTVVEAKALPPHYSAQAAELVALIRACELMKEKKVTIYTDSQYAHSSYLQISGKIEAW